jgi:hypothetical protein
MTTDQNLALSRMGELVDYRMAACARLGVINTMDEFGIPNTLRPGPVQWTGLWRYVLVQDPHWRAANARRDSWRDDDEARRGLPSIYNGGLIFVREHSFHCNVHGDFTLRHFRERELRCPQCTPLEFPWEPRR